VSLAEMFVVLEIHQIPSGANAVRHWDRSRRWHELFFFAAIDRRGRADHRWQPGGRQDSVDSLDVLVG
jgi:hypothetical protein